MNNAQTPEARAKLSRAMKGNRNGLGTVFSEEERARRSAFMRGPRNPMKQDKARATASARLKGKCRGPQNPNWNGGKHLVNGYVRVYTPEHPFANVLGYVFEHRLVMEAHLGRTLLPSEVVHHINGITDDNRIENLMLFHSNGEHKRNHKRRKT